VSTQKLRITFLGTGTSSGVPMIACTCAVCTSNDPYDNRLRSSLLVQSANTHLVVDTTPDFRYQMLRAKLNKLDALLYTHAHKDHIAGMDDVRAYNYFTKAAMPINKRKPHSKTNLLMLLRKINIQVCLRLIYI
jgi:phosphoribosyl 1,2-cyclic phosphate phosphodiesterase